MWLRSFAPWKDTPTGRIAAHDSIRVPLSKQDEKLSIASGSINANSPARAYDNAIVIHPLIHMYPYPSATPLRMGQAPYFPRKSPCPQICKT